MPLAEVYCNPSLLTGGNGSVGNPYGDVQLALDSFVHNGSGMRLNILAGTTETLTGALNIFTYTGNNGASLITEPLVLEGYTSTPGDGGTGYIEGMTNSCPIWSGITSSSEFDFLCLKNLRLVGGQTNGYAITADNQITIQGCEIISPVFGLDIDNGLIEGNRIVVSGSAAGGIPGILGAFGAVSVLNNYITFSAKSGAVAGTLVSSCNPVNGNIIDCRSTGGAAGMIVFANAVQNVAVNNTILGNSSGTTNFDAIRVAQPNAYIANNYIRGFNKGIYISSASFGTILENNKSYNNITNISDSGLYTTIIGGSSSLSSEGINLTTLVPTSGLIDSGAPTGFLGLSTINYPTVGAITTQHTSTGGTVNVNPLGGFLII